MKKKKSGSSEYRTFSENRLPPFYGIFPLSLLLLMNSIQWQYPSRIKRIVSVSLGLYIFNCLPLLLFLLLRTI